MALRIYQNAHRPSLLSFVCCVGIPISCLLIIQEKALVGALSVIVKYTRTFVCSSRRQCVMCGSGWPGHKCAGICGEQHNHYYKHWQLCTWTKICKYGDGSLLSLNWMQSSLFELNLIGGREDYFTNNWANTYTLHKWLPLCACICNNWSDRIADGSATECGSLVACYCAPAAGSPEKLSVPVVTDPASWSCGAAAGSAAAPAVTPALSDGGRTPSLNEGPHEGL